MVCRNEIVMIMQVPENMAIPAGIEPVTASFEGCAHRILLARGQPRADLRPAHSWFFLSVWSKSTAALGFGRDRHKQRIKFGIVQVLQRASQVLRQGMPQVRSSIVTVWLPG